MWKPDPAHTANNGFLDTDDVLALRNVRFAQFLLANKGTYVPSPDTLRKTKQGPPVETVDTLAEKIKALKTQHAKDLENLFKFQRSEYHQELVDHRIAHDVSAYMDIDEAYPDQVGFETALENLDKEVIKMDQFKRDADDALATLRYIHLRKLASLTAQRNGLKAQDKATRQKRDAWFPQTPDQYRQITEREVQLRIAHFLTGTTTEQERMSDEFGWPFRAVQPLLSTYKTNPAFKDEVDGAISGLFVSDPRRRGIRTTWSPVTPSFTRFEPVS